MVEPKVLSEEIVYDSDWIKIVSSRLEFPDGKTAKWNFPDFGEAVGIVAVDASRNVYLVKEWRLAHKRYVTQIPAGHSEGADTEEKLRKKARHELMEETGFDSKKLEKLCVGLTAGRIKQRFHLYLATELFPSKKAPDEHEYTELVKMPLREAISYFVAGEETTGFTLLGLTLADKKLK